MTHCGSWWGPRFHCSRLIYQVYVSVLVNVFHEFSKVQGANGHNKGKENVGEGEEEKNHILPSDALGEGAVSPSISGNQWEVSLALTEAPVAVGGPNSADLEIDG